MGDDVHYQEEKPERTGEGLSRRSLIEKGAMVAAVSAVPLKKTRILRSTSGSATTLKLMSWFQYEPGRHEAWNTMMAKFNKSQSKYKVVWTGWPANQYEDHVNTQVQAGGIDADVMTLIPDLAARLVQQGNVLAPINSIVKKVGVHPSASHNYIRKGGNKETFETLKKSPGLQDLWQVHRSLEAGDLNSDERLIANPEAECQGHWLKVSVASNGKYTVTNSRNNFSKTYTAR